MRVAVTRALPEAEQTAARLRARGAEPLLAPLLVREALPLAPLAPGAQALLFTSSASPGLVQDTQARALLALCVGDATAQAARAAGFADVRSADGDVEKLAALAQAELTPQRGRLVHVSGADVAGDLAGRLSAMGFEIERRVAYKAHAVTALPAAFAGPLDAVLFHSARAAQAFQALGAPGSGRLAAGCLSPAVAAAARQARWRCLIVAPAPREDALIDAVLGQQGASGGASA